MDAALIIVIAAVVLLIVFLLARRGWARSVDARREKAGELRVESTREEEDARRAEREAERQRERAERAARRADRLDPDADTGGGRLGFLKRNRGKDEDEQAERPREA